MATSIHPGSYELHDHAGAKWLASFSIPFVVAIITAFAMMLYPHL